jgi:hypothetical protein
MPLKTSPVKSKKTIKKTSSKKKEEKTIDDFVEIKEKIRDEATKKSGEFSPNEELDSKKEFFRLMAEKIKDEDGNFMEGDRIEDKKNCFNQNSRVLSYRKMITRFSFLVVILLLIVVYFFLIKLDIVAYSNKETLNDSLNFYAYASDGQISLEQSVKADISEEIIETSGVFESTGAKDIKGEIIGKVTIINKNKKNQPLVATTRLLSPDNKLYRIKKTVNVPAGGSVEVEIYADDATEDMAISPSKFIIPGLATELQDTVYAESSVQFEFKNNSKKLVTQEDIDKAISSLNEKMTDELEKKINKNETEKKYVFNIDSANSVLEVDKKVGDEVDSFEVKIKNTINIITINTSDVINIIKKKLALLDFNEDTSEINEETLSYTLLNFNKDKFLAEIKVDFSAKTALSNEEKIINTEHLVNLNEEQIKVYLNSLNTIQSYELNFKPKFIKRSSLLIDRINVVYK